MGASPPEREVVLADGTTEKIGKIVNQKLDVEVLSMNPETREISPKRIRRYFKNGQTDEWLRFEVAAAGGSGRRKFGCTRNHLIFTPSGERRAPTTSTRATTSSSRSNTTRSRRIRSTSSAESSATELCAARRITMSRSASDTARSRRSTSPGSMRCWRRSRTLWLPSAPGRASTPSRCISSPCSRGRLREPRREVRRQRLVRGDAGRPRSLSGIWTTRTRFRAATTAGARKGRDLREEPVRRRSSLLARRREWFPRARATDCHIPRPSSAANGRGCCTSGLPRSFIRRWRTSCIPRSATASSGIRTRSTRTSTARDSRSGRPCAPFRCR